MNEDHGTFCRRCSMEWDGRLGQFLEMAAQPKTVDAKLCRNCLRPYKPLRKGRCSPCAEYMRRHGTERPKELW